MNNTDKIKSVNWWHTINLNGILTPGAISYNIQMWNAQLIPEDLKGKTVLDIGAWDGFYSFLCEQRGATRVLAVDNYHHWIGEYNSNSGLANHGFLIAKESLNSNVEFRKLDANNIETIDEQFDIVICFGLLYHLESPYSFIRKISELCREQLLIESYIISDPYPIAYFYGDRELNNDPTNFWGMSETCVVKMCERAGFRAESISSNANRGLFRCLK